MRITRVTAREEAVELSRPYAIASDPAHPFTAADLFFLKIETDGGWTGLGSASPAADVTGETSAACAAALGGLGWLEGEDPRRLGALCDRAAAALDGCPAALAAVDMALHDLCARALGVPLVDLLGRRREPLPTSITVGLASVEKTLAEADELLGRGFRCLKVKIGRSLDEDLERLRKLRQRAGPGVTLWVDANQGYDVADTLRLAAEVDALGLELVEQPLPAACRAELAALPEPLRRVTVADESLHRVADAVDLACRRACGAFNVKLMKCGGIREALRIATVADAAGLALMWGCMDESRLSIAAALHAAYACPATRYLDLDGSFDLARDPATGGFVLDGGRLLLTGAPGLGVHLAGEW